MKHEVAAMIAIRTTNIQENLTSLSTQKIRHMIHRLLAIRPRILVMETILHAIAMQAAREAPAIPDLQAAVLAPAQALHIPALVAAPDHPPAPTRHPALVRRRPVRILHRRTQALRQDRLNLLDHRIQTVVVPVRDKICLNIFEQVFLGLLASHMHRLWRLFYTSLRAERRHTEQKTTRS